MGVATVLMAHMYPATTIVTLEPEPGNCWLLQAGPPPDSHLFHTAAQFRRVISRCISLMICTMTFTQALLGNYKLPFRSHEGFCHACLP